MVLVGLLKIMFVRQVFSNIIFHCPHQACNEKVEAQDRRAFPKIEAHLRRACATLCSLVEGRAWNRHGHPLC